MIKARIAELLDKEMDRKAFLTHVAAALVAMVGVTSVLRSLGEGSSSQKAADQARAYGGAPYGR